MTKDKKKLAEEAEEFVKKVNEMDQMIKELQTIVGFDRVHKMRTATAIKLILADPKYSNNLSDEIKSDLITKIFKIEEEVKIKN